jgi:starch phosphorylase
MDQDLKTDYEKNDLDINRFIYIRKKIRGNFLEYCKEYKDVEIGNRTIVAWCRRLAPYKRPNFIIDAIKDLPSEDFFFILSGKAHPQDIFGIEYMKLFREMHSKYENVIYVPNYDLSIAKKILKSADLLLFTPFPGWEACGTSYMKSALNGVPTLSSHDGAALELITDNVNGWYFGSDIKEFLQLNSEEVNNINREDYEDFKNKLERISSLHRDNLERYYKVSLNALTNMYSRINIKNVLMEYYPDQVRI